MKIIKSILGIAAIVAIYAVLFYLSIKSTEVKNKECNEFNTEIDSIVRSLLVYKPIHKENVSLVEKEVYILYYDTIEIYAVYTPISWSYYGIKGLDTLFVNTVDRNTGCKGISVKTLYIIKTICKN